MVLELLLLAVGSAFYGLFTYFAVMNRSYISALIFVFAIFMVFPIFRIITKPPAAVGFLMTIFSFILFLSGVYLFVYNDVPIPTVQAIAALIRAHMVPY